MVNPKLALAIRVLLGPIPSSKASRTTIVLLLQQGSDTLAQIHLFEGPTAHGNNQLNTGRGA
jgi:hypothetical protein